VPNPLHSPHASNRASNRNPLPRSRKGNAWDSDDAGVLVAANAARFRSPFADDKTIPPSISIQSPLEPIGPVGIDFRPIPRFARDAEGCHLIRVDTEPAVSLYGTGEVAGPMRRNGTNALLWNTDSFGYDRSTPALYQAHPWILALRPDGSAFGVLIDTTYRTEINLTAGIRVKVHGPAPAVYVINADSPDQVLATLAQWIGPMPLPPMWVLGFHQCRYSYDTQDIVLEVAKSFRKHDLPCDVIWCDIDYMDEYKVFTTHPESFENVWAMTRELSTIGMRTVYILDPGLKVDDDYQPYTTGVEAGHFVQLPDRSIYEGQVWPGVCAFPDFLNSNVRSWWGSLCADFAEHTGAAGLWTDMNEPAVFDGPDHTLPLESKHNADPELGGPGDHARYHNVYGMHMARATQEGLAERFPDQRPFVLSRSNYLGGQRYAACWTGDSASTWEHLTWTVPMMVNLGLSGQPLAGCDIGGFSHNATPELFARWMGIGCLLPFARAHSDKGTNPHEPWSFGDDTLAASRRALERRYRLLHYIYTLFYEHTRTGLPVMRPLFFADPTDEALHDCDDAFLLGEALLVRASITEDNIKRAPMPKGIWRRVEPAPEHDGSTHHQLPDLLLKGGCILPLGPIIQSTQQVTGTGRIDPLTLVVCLDENGQARGTLYEDQGDGFGYKDSDYLYTTYTARQEGSRVVIGIESADGKRPRHIRAAEILILMPNGKTVRGTGFGGDTIPVLLPDELEEDA